MQSPVRLPDPRRGAIGSTQVALLTRDMVAYGPVTGFIHAKESL